MGRSFFRSGKKGKKMTIVKWIYNGFKKSLAGYQSNNLQEAVEDSEQSKNNTVSTVHNTPPGEWPAECPKPSKLAVLLYYISFIATFIGSILMIRSFFYTEIDWQKTSIGCGLISIGMILLCITNCIQNREQKGINDYLQGQIEKMGLDENSRARRNLRHSVHFRNHEEKQMVVGKRKIWKLHNSYVSVIISE